MRFIRSLGLRGLLSFPPGMELLDLRALNVLIGPNGSGKTNLVETFELLRALPTDFAAAIRAGGGVEEWLWKGDNPARTATVEVETGDATPLRYRLEFASSNNRVEVLDEEIGEATFATGQGRSDFHYRSRRGNLTISQNIEALSAEELSRMGLNGGEDRRRENMETHISRGKLSPYQSVLAQIRDPDRYPELASLNEGFGRIQTFRDWTFGAGSEVRTPQRTDDPPDELLPNARNLSLVLNEIRHRDSQDLDETIRRFLPRYERTSTRIVGNTVQLFLHERGLRDPVPTTRLSDGTLRFLAIFAALLAPTPPSLLCLEKPELGMHPDAVALLAKLLVEASDRMQVVVTTHSDALLSALTGRIETVLVCENNGRGTMLERLKVERLAHWLDEYRLGDLWRMGELGGNP